MDPLALLTLVRNIAAAHRQARNLYLPRLAPDFNVFDFIRPDEMQLSAILRWLLDPRGSHGQGSRFLRLFLDDLGFGADVGNLEGASASNEVVIQGGRLDILVHFAGQRLVIENKPWAGDGEGQLAHYFQHLDDTAGEGPFVVIYLTRKGTAPSTNAMQQVQQDQRIAAGQLRLWSYVGEIRTWLARCRGACEADRVSTFIGEFSRYIETEFAGVRDRTMGEHIVNQIIANADYVEGAIQVITAADQIREGLWNILVLQLNNALPGHQVSSWVNPAAAFSCVSISYPHGIPYLFRLEFQRTQFQGLIVGIKLTNENGDARDAMHDAAFIALQNQIGPGTRNRWWLWYRNVGRGDNFLEVQQNWQNDPRPWVDITQGNLAGRIVNAFNRTQNVLQPPQAG